jgi:CRISPR/Cas system-associated endoribonuclease Cas2
MLYLLKMVKLLKFVVNRFSLFLSLILAMILVTFVYDIIYMSYENNHVIEYKYSADVWKNNSMYKIKIKENKIKKIELDTSMVPDSHSEDNILIIN